MGAVMFYHLQRHGMDDVIDMLVPRALQQGWRAMIRSPDRAALDRQDQRLWLFPEEGFLPHGLEGGPHDADQPVLLGAGRAANGAQAVLLMGPQPVDAEEAAGLERLWLAFDGRDEAQVQAARLQWKAVTAAGLAAQYWTDVSGRWEMKAESAASG
ncbi:DNA polymerase III subunit chi [Rhodobacter sp.]